jgi:PAS domain S-box-containing protein
VNDGIILRDPETRKILDLNRKLCEMSGYTAGEIKKMAWGWLSTSLGQDGKTVADHYDEAGRGKPQSFEWQFRKKDGTLFWVDVSLRRATIGDRESLLEVVRDITRDRQNREELRQREARYRSIMEDQTEFLVCRFLADGTMTFVNGALRRCVGLPKEELIGQTFWPFIAKEDIEKLRRHLAAPSADNPVATEHRIVLPDGRVRWLVWSIAVLSGRQETRECQAIGRDITERKEAEERLKESEKTIRALLDAITERVVLLDADRRILALNQTLAAAIGKEPHDVVGTCIDDHFDPEVTAIRKKYSERVLRRGKPERFNFEHDGMHFEYSVYPVFDDGGKVMRLAIYARDVTIQARAQVELEAKGRHLEEMNTALKVLLDQRELDRRELEEKVLLNVRQWILPVMHRLRDCGLNEEARAFVDVLEANVNEVISPFLRGLAAYQFTPRELEIISLVRGGRTTKEIARLLKVCRGAVDIYRHRIRKKLGITTVKTNLRSHLLSLSPQ